VLTVGVDLAAEPEGTALARIEWRDGQAVVLDVTRGADDAAVLAALAEADKAGVDCPLGWPGEFLRFVTAHQAGAVPLPPGGAAPGWRRALALRVTDLVVREQTGVTPLSVSADRIGYVAMRCAVLLAELARQGRPVTRDGTGPVAEVYPAASLKVWGLPHRGYKRPADPAALERLMAELTVQTPFLQQGSFTGLCRRSHDAADALIAALAARAAARGLTLRPRDSAEQAAARTEGWVAIPLAGTRLSQLP
jgi:predicted nuclease with RNAse H fold